MNKVVIPQKIDFLQDIIANDSIFLDKIENSKCLIIGGAGTIGSHYIKEVLEYKPKLVVVVDSNENGLTELTRDLRSSNLLDYNPEYISYPVDLMSETFDKIFFKTHFDLVANFAAHKHVRSEKDSISIEALIKNNIFGAIKLLNLCKINKPKYFFSVSTDKASSPVNIMGASKLVMEKLILSQKNNFRVSTARFANVSFSNGSLLDGFINRINKLQPLSCPNDIKRFFVTPKQSGQICLISTFLGKSGDIFFPKLDFKTDQIYFKDIAIDFLEKNGFNPVIVDSENEAKSFNFDKSTSDYPIFFFKSNTSGEKKYEEFFSDDDIIDLNQFISLGIIESVSSNIRFDNVINDFTEIFQINSCEKSDIIKVLKKYAPEFSHAETGFNLDQKM